jgi:hypothetical protein
LRGHFDLCRRESRRRICRKKTLLEWLARLCRNAGRWRAAMVRHSFGESAVDEIILELGTVSEETQGLVAGWLGDSDPDKMFTYFPD